MALYFTEGCPNFPLLAFLSSYRLGTFLVHRAIWFSFPLAPVILPPPPLFLFPFVFLFSRRSAFGSRGSFALYLEPEDNFLERRRGTRRAAPRRVDHPEQFAARRYTTVYCRSDVFSTSNINIARAGSRPTVGGNRILILLES